MQRKQTCEHTRFVNNKFKKPRVRNGFNNRAIESDAVFRTENSRVHCTGHYTTYINDIRQDGCQSMVILPGPPLSEPYSGLDRLKPDMSVILYVFGGSASLIAFLNSAEWLPPKTCTLNVLLWGAPTFMYWSKNSMNSSFLSSLSAATCYIC